MKIHTLIKLANKAFGVGIIITIGLIAARMLDPTFLSGHGELNEGPAIIATFLLLATLLPGTLQRMGFSRKLLKYPIVFRRTVGIAMYMFALLHFLFLIDYLPWFSEGLIKNLDALTASGIAAVIILAPALLTSNNISVRYLGKWWKVIQRVTYLIIPFVAIHLWQAGETPLAILYAIMTVLIIISYYMQNIRKGASPLITSLWVIGMLVLTATLVFGVLKILFKNPQDQKQEAALVESQARVEELEKEVAAKFELLAKQDAELEELKKVERERMEAIAKSEAEAAEKKRIEQEEVAAEKTESERIAALSDYTNGTYTGVGSYSTDGGDKTERIDVRLSISNDTVTNVEIISHVKATKSHKYVNKFNKDIASVVVGKKVDALNVHGIGGASDTSTGFRTALASIKGQAKS